MDVETDAIPTDFIPGVWETAAPELQRALDLSDGEMTITDIFAQLVSGYMQLWVAHENETALAYAVTSVEVYPQIKAARIVLLAGAHMDQWQHFIEKIERWAVSCGCDYVEWFGRPGWVREMAKHGYQRRYTLCRKRLTMEDKSKVLH